MIAGVPVPAVRLAAVPLLTATLRPRHPYRLARSAIGGYPTRRVRDGVLSLAFEAADAPARADVRQRPDGDLELRIEAEDGAAALDRVRFLLACDVDVAPFLRLAEADPLLRRLVPRARGYRPLRLGTIAHAVLRALAGQLIQSSEARRIESRLIQRSATPHGDLYLPPRREQLATLPPARLVACGLASRRAAALTRVLRSFDVERLAGLPAATAAARLQREPNLGPWSAGVVCLEGLGSFERGLAGDLGLIRLCTALLGRPAAVEDTERLLARYGEWAGLASLHLLGHPLARTRARGAAVLV
jgi:3-methyladenine DNA glycosylase/8-oxoguanine DNA glycosylase